MTNRSLPKIIGDTHSLIANHKKNDPIKRKLEEAEARIALLEQKCDHRDKILAILAHDMRSPISSITSLMSVFYSEQVQEDLREPVAELQKQLISVNELMNNLLRWASHSFETNEEDRTANIDVRNVIELNIALIGIIAREKNVTLTNNIAAPLLARANTDHTDIIIRNILLNAVKFTLPKGNITINGSVQDKEITLTIADTGVGMTTEQLSSIFTDTHLSTYGTRGEKGFGLGLLLCKEYLNANKGTIAIASKVNEGTTITITLPVA